MTTEKRSTPITPEGLLGLGFVHTEGSIYKMYRLGIGKGRMTMLDGRGFGEDWIVWFTNRPKSIGDTIGTAPDLETVADLIDVLKRMNGGD